MSSLLEAYSPVSSGYSDVAVSSTVEHTAEDENWFATQSVGGCGTDELSPDEIAFLSAEKVSDAEYDAWVDAQYADRHDAFIGGVESW